MKIICCLNCGNIQITTKNKTICKECECKCFLESENAPELVEKIKFHYSEILKRIESQLKMIGEG